jgi:hypothetical protein
MSEINANFVVTQTPLTISTETSNITVDTDPINLNVFALGFTSAGGQPGNLQYNDAGGLNGAANTVVSAGNVRFTNISNLKIANGSNGYYLQTDGTGNLTWSPGTVTANANGTPVGANTQIQVTDGAGNFVSAPGFTFDNSTNVFTTPGNAVINGNLTATANITANYFIGNGSQLTGISGNVNVINANATSNTTYYPVFVSGIGNVEPQIDNFGNVLAFIPHSGTLNTNILDISTIKNSNGNVVISNNVVVNANVSANYFIGNGSALTDITGANVTGQVANALISGTVYTNAQPNITSVGTLSSLAVTGNVTAGNVYSNSGTIGANLLFGTLTTAAQPNITSLGNLTDLRLDDTEIHLGLNAGNINQGPYAIALGFNAGNLNQDDKSIAIGFEAGLANLGIDCIALGTSSQNNYPLTVTNAISIGYSTATGNNSISIGALTSAPNYAITLNATGANLGGVSNGFVVKPIRQANLGNILYYNQSTGEICYDTGGGTPTRIENGTSNVNISAVNGNITFGVNGTSNVIVVANTNANISNLVVSNSANVIGNLTSGNANLGNLALANYLQGNGVYISNINANVVYGMVASANIARYVSENVQPNITGLGTQDQLLQWVSGGNLTSANAINLNYQNIRNGYIIAGNLINATTLSATNCNVSTAINMTNNADIILTGAGSNISGANLISGNYITGTLTTAAQPNITSTGTLTSLTITGNITAGNANLGNLITANYVKLNPIAFASLPTAANAGSGVKAIITDGNTTTYYANVSGGGTNTVPVFSTGTVWKVG